MTFLRYQCPFALLLSLFVWSLLSLSCGRDDLKPPVKGKVSWTVNGSAYTADYITYAAIEDSSSYFPRAEITGITYAKSTLNIDLKPIKAPGVFKTSDPPMDFHAVYITVNNSQYWAHHSVDSAASVTIRVAELTADKIKGSFEGVLVEDNGNAGGNKVSVSGTFDVPFVK